MALCQYVLEPQRHCGHLICLLQRHCGHLVSQRCQTVLLLDYQLMVLLGWLLELLLLVRLLLGVVVWPTLLLFLLCLPHRGAELSSASWGCG